MWNGTAWSLVGEQVTTANQRLIIKSANESVPNSITLQDDDELLFPVAANDTWVGEFSISYTATTTSDIKFAVTAPSGATCMVNLLDEAGATNLNLQSANVGCGVAIVATTNIATGEAAMVTFSVVNGATPGNITLQWAQVTAGATASIVLK